MIEKKLSALCLPIIGFTFCFFLSASTAGADAGARPTFEIRQLRVENGQREIVKFNTETGETWSNWTSSPPQWSKVPENGPVPSGDYDILLLNGPDKDTTWGIRFDRKSGRTWNFGANGWTEFKDAN